MIVLLKIFSWPWRVLNPYHTGSTGQFQEFHLMMPQVVCVPPAMKLTNAKTPNGVDILDSIQHSHSSLGFFRFNHFVPILWWKETGSPIFTDPSAVDNSNPEAIRLLRPRHINYEVHYPSKKRRIAFVLLHVVECRWSNTRGFNS